MDYTSIHIYGHLFSDDILHEIETDSQMQGNREQDFSLDVSLTAKIDNAWSSLRNDWKLFSERNLMKDPYGTRSVRRLMERFFSSIDFQLDYQSRQVEAEGRGFDIPYLCPELDNMPIIIVGDKTGDTEIDTLDKCTLDIRAKGQHRQKSPHATMLDFLNNTEHVYGIVTNGLVLRLIRNTGQLVKLTYAEFDLRRMVEEDHYAEFCLMFRLLHASRFMHTGVDAPIIEQWFNRSIESGNRIRAGLSDAVQHAMEILGRAVVCGQGEGNEAYRTAYINNVATAQTLNKELIHFIYRLLFLFIIEDRGLVYQLGSPDTDSDYEQKVRWQDIYKKYYAVSRLRSLSEKPYLRTARYHDLWESLMDSFRLFEDEAFGASLGIKPLGGVLFDNDTLHYLKRCTITNDQLLAAFACLNEFTDERHNRVKINYSSLDVEEFGSVYEGILEMRAVVVTAAAQQEWQFHFGKGQDRKSSSSYYTRPDLVQSLIRTTLIPVIEQKIKAAPTTDEKIRSLLSMKVCDAASGSGHIVLAMARTLAWYVCQLRTGEDNPASLDYREALREVIQRCVYAVDFNPDAVELCKVVLWIEGYCAGKPLSFLDHHIRCGNSVVGITNLDVLLNGVPKEAFAATTKEAKKKITDLNKEALRDVSLVRQGQAAGMSVTLFSNDFAIQSISEEQVGLAGKVREINALPENTLLEELTKQSRWEDLMQSPRVECLRRACDIYTYAFYHQFTDDDFLSEVDEQTGMFSSFNIPYTRTVYQALQEIKYIDIPQEELSDCLFLPQSFKNEVDNAATVGRYFHWCVEFPEVFADGGGFDVMCGNPPWDKLQMEDEKWFEGKDESVVHAANQAARNRKIAELEISNPTLFKEYVNARLNIACQANFIKNSGRFPLTAVGKIDLFPLFAEHCLNSSKDAWGLVMPTGICINDSNKMFFAKLIDENRLISLYSFENEEKIFSIHHSFKFCLLTAGYKQEKQRKVSGGFYLRRLDHLLDPNRIYTLGTQDFVRLNPNTKTCPVFRTNRDAQLTAKIYRNSAILFNESSGDNPWKVKFGSMFNMSTDSGLFHTYFQLTNQGAKLCGNHFYIDDEEYVPLYEGKMFSIYNHHYANWPKDGERPNTIPTTESSELTDVNHLIVPWYWVKKEDVDNHLVKTDNNGNIVWKWEHKWLIGFRDITSSITERTFLCSLIPDACGVGNTATLLYAERGCMPASILLAMMSSIVFDYTTRQKIGGSHASISFVKQFPVLTPEQIPDWEEDMIVERVAELCYFNHDLDGWMDELWHDEEMTDDLRTRFLDRLEECNGLYFDDDEFPMPEFSNMQPYIYNEERRAVAQAELDAIFAHLYGLTTEELRYILDPEDICGRGCINETFRVLKDRELHELGEYRTKRLVMEAWQRFGFQENSES